MHEIITDGAEIRHPKVAYVPVLADADRTLVDRIVFSDTPAHLIADDPFGSVVARRIGEDIVVRDYFATFAYTSEGARRVLGLALALARSSDTARSGKAAGWEVAGWCALSLGRWELADALALRAQGTGSASGLSELIRRAVAERWMAEVMGIEAEISVEDIRQCAATTLRRLVIPHTFGERD